MEKLRKSTVKAVLFFVLGVALGVRKDGRMVVRCGALGGAGRGVGEGS